MQQGDSRKHEELFAALWSQAAPALLQANKLVLRGCGLLQRISVDVICCWGVRGKMLRLSEMNEE